MTFKKLRASHYNDIDLFFFTIQVKGNPFTCIKTLILFS